MNTDELLEKAVSCTITQTEIDKVYHALLNHEADEYDLLLILGRAEATKHKEIVEKYLISPDDPMLARLALQILCRYWGLSREYRSVIEQFIHKVEWDTEEDVRLMAISCSGDILKNKSNLSLLSYLYNIFNDDTEDKVIREAAYETLALVSGKSVQDLPSPMRFDFSNDVDPNVLETIEARLSFNK